MITCWEILLLMYLLLKRYLSIIIVTIYVVMSACTLFYVSILHNWFIYVAPFIIITFPFFLKVFYSFSWNCYCFVFILFFFFFFLVTCSIFVSVVAFFLFCVCVFICSVYSFACFCVLSFPVSILKPNSFCFCHSCQICFLIFIIDIDFDAGKKPCSKLFMVKVKLFILQLFCRESRHSWLCLLVKVRSA